MSAPIVVALTDRTRSGEPAPRGCRTQVKVFSMVAAAATARSRPSLALTTGKSSSWQAPPAAAAGAVDGLAGGCAPASSQPASEQDQHEQAGPSHDAHPIACGAGYRGRRSTMCLAISRELVAAGDGALRTWTCRARRRGGSRRRGCRRA